MTETVRVQLIAHPVTIGSARTSPTSRSCARSKPRASGFGASAYSIATPAPAGSSCETATFTVNAARRHRHHDPGYGVALFSGLLQGARGLREFSFFLKRTPRFRASGRVFALSAHTRRQPDAHPSNQDGEWAQV
jgi:hypothetical protein